jgi:hypothetical protein
MEGLMSALALAVGVPDQTTDPIRQLVLELLVSYGGIAGGAAMLSEGLKRIFSKMTGQENYWTFLLTFVLGAPAKYLFPNSYGPTHTRAWVFHLIVLLFVGVGAAAMRERLLERASGLLAGLVKKDDAEHKPATKVLKPDDNPATPAGGGGQS